LNKNKEKGDRWEREVVNYLTEKLGTVVERRKAGWTLDKGDLIGVTGFCIDCKDTALTAMGPGMDKAITSWRNSKQKYVVMIQKRRNKKVEDAYVVMPMWMWLTLLEELDLDD